MSYKQITPDITEIKTGTPAIKVGDKYVVGGIGGNFIPGGTNEQSVVLGQIDADGNFQPLTFNGTEASNSGDPEAVESYYGWNGVLPSPSGGIRVIQGGDAVYYKCASVDTVNKTWSGYLAVLDTETGIWSFETETTTGLTYGTAYTPKQDGIYNADATVQVSNLWQGAPVAWFDLPLNGDYIATWEGAPYDCSDGAESSVAFVSATGLSGMQAVEFNGGMITLPVDANFWGNDATIFLRVYQTSSSRNGFFINSGGCVTAIDTSGGVYSVWSGDGASWNNSQADGSYGRSTQSVILNQWVDIAYVHDAVNDRYKLYVNDILVFDKGPESGTDHWQEQTSDNKIVIGRWGQWGYNFVGQMRDFRIYKQALTADDIALIASV